MRKVCRTCGIEKLSSAFYVDVHLEGGLTNHCKECMQTVYARPAESETKVCRLCGEVKLYSDFHRNPRLRDGFAHECKTCARKINRAAHVRRKYGISQQDYDALHASQDGVCAICGQAGRKILANNGKLKRAPRLFSQLYVDHDHVTGKVRGLLCNDCNIAIGAFQDSKTILLAAIRYLERNQET